MNLSQKQSLKLTNCYCMCDRSILLDGQIRSVQAHVCRDAGLAHPRDGEDGHGARRARGVHPLLLHRLREGGRAGRGRRQAAARVPRLRPAAAPRAVPGEAHQMRPPRPHLPALPPRHPLPRRPPRARGRPLRRRQLQRCVADPRLRAVHEGRSRAHREALQRGLQEPQAQAQGPHGRIGVNNDYDEEVV